VKIIFLDMDGVLCTPRAHVAQGMQAPRGVQQSLDREAIGLLNVLMPPNQPIFCVLASTWRNIYDPAWIDRRLMAAGWEGQFHTDWKTASLGDESKRGEEIALWLASHETERYVILDDSINMLPEQEPFHVKTNYNDGLMWDDFKKAMLILHGVTVK